jgi:hypothetical protein
MNSLVYILVLTDAYGLVLGIRYFRATEINGSN